MYPNNGPRNPLDYIGLCDHNLHVSLTKFPRTHGLIIEVGEFYSQLEDEIASLKLEKHLSLLLFFSKHQYFESIRRLWSTQVTDSMASLRRSIDAGLTVYELWIHPELKDEYLKGGKKFQFIKANIVKARKSDPSTYPLAKELIDYHEMCSQYSSHADMASFVHKYEYREDDSGNASITYKYAELLPDDDFLLTLANLIYANIQILHIYMQSYSEHLADEVRIHLAERFASMLKSVDSWK